MAKDFTKIKVLFLDFDGVLTDNKVIVTGREGEEFVICDRSDSLGINMLTEAGVRVHIISKERNGIVKFRAAKLGVTCDAGIDDKLEVLKRRVAEWGLEREETAFIGNDRNDLPCLRAVGIAIVPKDAFPVVAEAADYITERNGGDGCVREVCELIVNID